MKTSHFKSSSQNLIRKRTLQASRGQKRGQATFLSFYTPVHPAFSKNQPVPFFAEGASEIRLLYVNITKPITLFSSEATKKIPL